MLQRLVHPGTGQLLLMKTGDGDCDLILDFATNSSMLERLRTFNHEILILYIASGPVSCNMFVFIQYYRKSKNEKNFFLKVRKCWKSGSSVVSALAS